MLRKVGIVFITLMMGVASSLFGAEFNIDQSHSYVGFSVKHLVISTVKGNFQDYSGSIVFDENNLKDSKITGTVFVKSVDTSNKKRDKHLIKDDFFNAKDFPEITFETTSITKDSQGNYVAIANFTIRDVTKVVSVPLEISPRVKGPWGKYRRNFSGSFDINRKEYNVNWSKSMDNGTLVVSDVVRIEFEIAGVEK